MPRGPFSCPITPTSVAAATDLIHMTVTADAPVTLTSIELYNTSDFGDAQEEVLSMALVRTTTGGGTGGTAMTEVNFGDGGGSTPLTAVVAFTTAITTGGAVLANLGWNVRIPFLYMPPPELRPSVDSTQDPLVLRLLAAPADAITIGGTVYWFEA